MLFAARLGKDFTANNPPKILDSGAIVDDHVAGGMEASAPHILLRKSAIAATKGAVEGRQAYRCFLRQGHYALAGDVGPIASISASGRPSSPVRWAWFRVKVKRATQRVKHQCATDIASKRRPDTPGPECSIVGLVRSLSQPN